LTKPTPASSSAPGDQSRLIEATRIHARPAQQHPATAAGQYPFEHSLNIIIAIRRLLSGLGGDDSIGHQKMATSTVGAFFASACASLSALYMRPSVGRVVHDEKHL
jgi:hypothetical protein